MKPIILDGSKKDEALQNVLGFQRWYEPESNPLVQVLVLEGLLASLTTDYWGFCVFCFLKQRQLGFSGERSRPGPALFFLGFFYCFAFRWNTGACSALAPPTAGRIKTQQNKHKKSEIQTIINDNPQKKKTMKKPSSLYKGMILIMLLLTNNQCIFFCMLRVLYKLQIHVCCLAPRYRNICQSVCLSAYVRLHVCIDSPTLHKEPPNTAGLFYWVRGDSPCRKVRVLQHVRRLRRQSKAKSQPHVSGYFENSIFF